MMKKDEKKGEVDVSDLEHIVDKESVDLMEKYWYYELENLYQDYQDNTKN